MEVRATKIGGLEQLWITRARAAQARVEHATAEQRSASVKISQQADLLRQMSTLKQSDPDKFQEVLGSVSANLTAAANSGSGQVGSELSSLAKSLAKVAKSGDLARMQDLSPTSTNSANRAIEAYLRNARPAIQPTDTSRQALQYVLSTLAEANQDVAPTEGAAAASRR